MDKNKKVIDVTKEFKKAERKRKREEFLNKAKDFWEDNKQYIVIIVPAVGYGIGKVVKTIGRHHNLKQEERNKELYCWDASLGHYWKLRRPLKNDDWTFINRRKNAGESLGDILESMNVLK